MFILKDKSKVFLGKMNIRIFVEWMKLPESCNIPLLAGWWYRLTSALDNKLILSERIPLNPLNSAPRDKTVIVSLTSYPARIEYVWLAVKSLMLQSYKPDRIILWLAEEQFPTRELPENLMNLVQYGLEIKWIKDLYGHKKYYFPVKNQKKDEVVITFDDDIIYSPKCIERLMTTHYRFPDCLVCERGQVFKDKTQQNPGRWDTLSEIGVAQPTFSMNPSPGSGCLIPYKSFHDDALLEQRFRELAFKNDDLWYMFMCAQNGTKMIKTRRYHKIFSLIKGSQMEQMATENVVGDKNLLVMEGLKAAYPKAWQRILTDTL